MPHALRTVLAAIVALTLAIDALAPATAQDDDPLAVVATFSVLADIVTQVGGDHVAVTSLVPVGGDAHTFDPSPDQVLALTEADLIVEVGGDFEPWLADLVEASGSDAPRVSLFADDDHGDHEATADDDHAHGDEVHRWLDVHTTIDAVGHLIEALQEADPDRADAYAERGAAYIAELEELDAYIVAQTETLPEERRQLITTHQSMGAFADAYGYEIPGVLLESHTTESADAPAGHVAELVGVIEERGIPAVFPDTPGGEAQLQPLAEAAGVAIAPSLYVDTLGEDGSGAETYVAMMRHNIDTIVTALSD